MTLTRFAVDRCEVDVVAGWLDQNGSTNPLTIEVNGVWICDLSPTQFRVDLLEAGMGDGRRAFSFPLAGYLNDPVNKISLKLQGAEIYSKILVSTDIRSKGARNIYEYSQFRWKSDEPDEGLTWGSIMDSQSLWGVYRGAREFRAADRILEIGPGYGRLLLTALEQKIPFASYVGLDLSPSRVEKLRTRFRHPHVIFVTGDANNWHNEEEFDVIICSSTFEHLYPDCKNALQNLRRQLADDGWVFIDFIWSLVSESVFEANTAFVRSYTESELRQIFMECRFDVRDVTTCIIGVSATREPVKRYVVIARPSAGAS